MNPPPLLRHGATTKPVYAAAANTTSWAGKSNDQERPDGQVSGIVKRYNKGSVASIRPTAMNLAIRKHADAVEFTGISSEVRGLALFAGAISAAISTGLGQMMAIDLFQRGLGEVFYQVAFGLAVLLVVFGIYSIMRAIRLEMFRPVDEPIIFDRKNRKVYRLFRETHPGLAGLLKPWPMRAAEYDWDLIDAEHNAVLFTTGSTVNRYHHLIFIVRKSADDATIIDSFEVGNTMLLCETSVDPLWEHIRRFMECDGPHLPPGEVLNTETPPLTLWESMGSVGPFGPGYLAHWKNDRFLMIIYHLFSILFVPMFFFWGLFNWMSFATARPIAWPPEVFDAVGQPE